MRLTPIAALALLPGLAAAAPTLAHLSARATECQISAAFAKQHALADGSAIQATGADGSKVLFLPGDGCDTVFPVGRASARVRGRFDAKGQVVKAFVLTQNEATCPGEDEGGCRTLLVFKDKAGAYPAAVPLGSCEQVELSATALFGPKHQGVLVACAAAGGGDMWSHSQHLVALTPAGPKMLLSAHLGYSSTAEGSAEFEGRADLGAACRTLAPGKVTISRPGPKPVAEVITPASEDPEAKLLHKTLAWDGARFALQGAPQVVAPKATTRCGPDTKKAP